MSLSPFSCLLGSCGHVAKRSVAKTARTKVRPYGKNSTVGSRRKASLAGSTGTFHFFHRDTGPVIQTLRIVANG